MSGTEMLNNFNVLYNNITSNQAPGLNSYEIDLFLTKAQYQLWKNNSIIGQMLPTGDMTEVRRDRLTSLHLLLHRD